tara:strand:- start:13478 stop:14068 length:591 start_codon:yes stop_codon:yes gene_type:complete
MKKTVTDHGNFILSAELVSKKDCKDIIKFIDTYEEEHSVLRDYSEKKRNTNSKEIELSAKLDLPKAKEIDDIIFKRVGEAIKKFIVENVPNAHSLMNNLEDTGYQLRKIIGPTLEHSDGIEINIFKDAYKYRVGTLIISLKDTGDEIVFPHLDITVPLKQGTILFFPPYWTHVHYSNWNEQEGYRIQTWLTNNKSI